MPDCAHCEQNCCTQFFIILEEIKDKDWLRWLSYHKGVKIVDLGQHKIQVWFELPCTKLDENMRCTIYPKRPKLCRKFKCPLESP